VLLPFEFLQQIGLQIGAAGDFENFKNAEQCDVMFLRVRFRGEVLHALVQILEPQQRANPLAQRVFVTDHGEYGAPGE
jgi:hypothetical protein